MYKNPSFNIINIIFFSFFLFYNNAFAIADNESRIAIIEIKKRLDKDQISKLQFATQIQDIQQELSQLRNQIELIYNSKNIDSNIHFDQMNKQQSEEQEYCMYEYAMSLFNKGKYKEAEESFMAFKAIYYNSKLEPQIIFFLGSTRYALKNFKGVIEELNNLIKLYPNHILTADAMLIIANSQLELDLKMAAKNTLKTIIKKYPESKAAFAANNRLKIL